MLKQALWTILVLALMSLAYTIVSDDCDRQVVQSKECMQK